MLRLLACTPFLLLAACSASGGAQGLVTSPGGAPLGSAQFHYVTHGGTAAALTALLPDGERFTGDAISQSSESAPGLGLVVGRKPRDTGLVFTAPGRQWSGAIEAVLIGDQGSSMTCHLLAKRPSLGLEGGASGTCRTGDGRQIAARF